jgi:hypothetical protein
LESGTTFWDWIDSVAGTDLGGSEFFQCKGDFVPAALRERNFFGGEHDFPVMKVELGGEWS